MKSPSIKVSVIIPAYGQCEHLVEVVDALLRQTVQPHQILIGHSGSGDPSETAGAMDPRVEVFHTDKRMFAGAARNHAAEYASGDWLAFLDADVIPDQDWIEAFLQAVELYGDANYFAGSLGYAQSGGYWGLCLWMIELGSQHPYMPAQEVQSMGGGNGFISRSNFVAVGGFPRDMKIAEDSFLQRRLRERGITIRFWPRAVGCHCNIGGLGYFLNHLKPLGENAAYIRQIFQYKGSAAARHPVLALGLLPARLLLIYARVLRWGTGYRLMLLGLTPGLILGLATWTNAFIRGSRKRNADDDGR